MESFRGKKLNPLQAIKAETLQAYTATLRNPKLKNILVELFEDEEAEVTELLSSLGFKKIKMKSRTPHARLTWPYG